MAERAKVPSMDSYGEMKSFDPTYRMKTRDAIANYLQSLGLASTPQTARDMAEGFTGSPNPAIGYVDSLGVLDFTPVGLGFGAEEVKRDLKSAETPVDYAVAGAGAILTGLEAYPLTKTIARPVKKFLNSLNDKIK